MKRNSLKRILIYSFLAYLVPGLVLFFSQRNFLYFPVGEIHHKYDQMSLQNSGETINVIVLNKGQAKAIIYFGGNGEQAVCNATDFLKAFPDFTVYLFNYRGYSGSTGTPTEKGIFSDALLLYDRIDHQHLDISVVGRSLGSGVAVYLASERPVAKMVLVTPFDSIRNVAQQQYFMYPMSLLLKDKYDSIGRVVRIKSSTLVLIAEKDTVIPYNNSIRLVHAFPEGQVTAKVFKGADHNSISWEKNYYEDLRTFLCERKSGSDG